MDTILGVLGESSVRAIVIAIAVACILWGMLVKSPAICHRAWTGVLLAMLFLPIISLWAPRITIPLLPPASSLQMQRPQDATVGQNPSLRVRISTVETAKPDMTVVQYQHSQTRAQEALFRPATRSTPAPETAPPVMTVAEYQNSQSNLSSLPDKTLYEKGMTFLEKHQFKEARRAFQTLINTFPDSGLAASSYLAIGDSFYDEGGTENLLQAEDQYKYFVIFFPTHPKAADAQLKVISINIRMMRAPNRNHEYSLKAARAIREFIEQFPDSEFVPIVQKYLNDLPELIAKGSSAGVFLQSRESDHDEYYRRWLNEDVVYIISEEEKKGFNDLRSDEEREHFIEQFWARRNPDPGSRDNSFKEEHYRRIAYANKRFASNLPGWKMDRGRIFIMYGPPSEIESNPSGGIYSREGRKTSKAFPFELWRYHHIDGIGDQVTILFVDRMGTGDYRILTPGLDHR